MALGRSKALVVAVAAAVAIGAALYTGAWGGRAAATADAEESGPLAEGALGAGGPAEGEEDPGLVIHGFVQARTLDPARWSVRGLPLVYQASGDAPTCRIDSRGRFELTRLLDVDYRVELICEGERPIVLASAEHVRPGGDELVLELDPLAVARLRDLRDHYVRPRE